MILTSFLSRSAPHSESGTVTLELFFSVGVLILLTAAIVDFGLGFQNSAAAENAARDLAQAGAGHNPSECEPGTETLTACEVACARATTTLCTYGLNPGSYSVDVHQSANWPDMLEATISKNGAGFTNWSFTVLPTASAAFALEGAITKNGFDPQGCGECTLGECS